MSTQAMSQTRHWPDFHGAMEQPSGRLPSDLHRPMGSSVDDTFIAASDLCMMALISSMPQKTTLAFNAVSSKGINITSMVVADVGLTEWCTQTETGCVTIHLQAWGRDRKGMQPGPRLFSGCSQ